MAKAKRRRKSRAEKRARVANLADKRGLVYMRHPFSNIPWEKLREGFIEIAKTSQDEFLSRVESIKALLGGNDPLLVIAMLSTYGLTGSIDSHGKLLPSYKGDEFSQAHVELVQALTLSLPLTSLSHEFPHPQVIQTLFDDVPKLSDSFRLRRFTQLEQERSDAEKAVLLIQEELRLHTQVVRNWGFLSRVADIVRRLCEPIDASFQQHAGMTTSDLIRLFTHLIRRFERRVSERWEGLVPVFQERTIEGMIRAYYKANPNFKDNAEDLIALAKQNLLSIENVKAMILSHSDLSLSGDYTYSANILAAETDLDAASITSVLDSLSLSFGDLADESVEHFFLGNPVWTKPIIRLDDGEYFCAMPQAFFSFVFPILSEVLAGNKEATQRYEDRRAEFLETEVARIFSESFPRCEINQGYRWPDEDKEYENDLIVRVDSHLILVEAKSHSVSWSALRGAPDRAKRHVKEILLDPSVQSLRLATRIYEAMANIEDRESLLPKFPFPLENIHTILRLSVTLEDFATLQASIHRARGAGWIPQDHPIAPCVSLADLEIVFDILQSTPHKIHYLKRRADLEARLSYKGDELDLLGVYLKTGFNFGSEEFSNRHIALLGMSKPIDDYYMAQEEGIGRPKPAPLMTGWWKDICAKIEERDFPQWSDVAVILLSVPMSEQEAIAKRFKKIAKNVHQNWRNPDHLCAVILVPPEGNTDAIALYAFKEAYKDERYERMENVASGVFESSHCTRCLVIGVNVDKEQYPYSLVAVYFQSDVSHSE